MANSVASVYHTISFWDGDSRDAEQLRCIWSVDDQESSWRLQTVSVVESYDISLNDRSYVVLQNLDDDCTATVNGLEVPPGQSISVFLPKGSYAIELCKGRKHKIRFAICEGI